MQDTSADGARRYYELLKAKVTARATCHRSQLRARAEIADGLRNFGGSANVQPFAEERFFAGSFMHNLRTLAGLFLLFSVVGACSDDSGRKKRKDDNCDLGDIETCTCLNGSTGTRVCDNREKFGSCECDGSSGGSSGRGGSGGSSGKGVSGSGGSVLPGASCDRICDYEANCYDVVGCDDLCANWEDSGTSSCQSAVDAWASCVYAYGPTCSTITSACSSFETSVASYCETVPGANSCSYAYDGFCDEPTLCADGTDTYDCTPLTCPYTNDGYCDEPTTCPTGTDTVDCASSPTCPYTNDWYCDEGFSCSTGTDTADCQPCQYTNNGTCDEGIRCSYGTDTTDCSSTPTCPYTNDGFCDEPNTCPVGTDTVDCAASSCPSTNDGVCDERLTCSVGTDVADCAACPYQNDGLCDEGTNCSTGTDPNDCANLGNDCEWAFDTECDEPTLCPEGTDTADCSGLNTCTYAYNGTCDEPDPCPAGTDGEDCSTN